MSRNCYIMSNSQGMGSQDIEERAEVVADRCDNVAQIDIDFVYILVEIQLREEILSQIGSSTDIHRSIERYMRFVTQRIAFASNISTKKCGPELLSITICQTNLAR